MKNPFKLLSSLQKETCCHFAVLIGLIFASGCGMVREAGMIPTKTVSRIVGGRADKPTSPEDLQIELQRSADEYLERTVAALDSYAYCLGTDEARQQALRWKISFGSSVIGIVSSPNPHAALVDLLSLSTASRLVLEEYWVKTAGGAAFQPWLNTSRELETNAWKLAENVLTPAQQQELRDSIYRGSRVNDGRNTAFFDRPQSITTLIQKNASRAKTPESVFAYIGLDPVAGLDPAVRELTRSRLYAERALYAAQRMPWLLRWQMELLSADVLGNPQVTAALTNATSLGRSADRFSRAAESLGQTASQLPDRLSAERKALIDALEAQEEKIGRLSGEVAQTLVAGERMSTSLNTALITFDALMQRFGVGRTNASPQPGTSGEPFRIQDYGDTAARIEAATRELNELLTTLDHTLGSTNLMTFSKQVAPVLHQARDSGREVVDYAFKKAVLLVVLTLLAALIYRFFAVRLVGDPSSRRRS